MTPLNCYDVDKSALLTELSFATRKLGNIKNAIRACSKGLFFFLCTAYSASGVLAPVRYRRAADALRAQTEENTKANLNELWRNVQSAPSARTCCDATGTAHASTTASIECAAPLLLRIRGPRSSSQRQIAKIGVSQQSRSPKRLLQQRGCINPRTSNYEIKRQIHCNDTARKISFP